MRGAFRGRVLIVEDEIDSPQAPDLLRAAVAAGWFVTFYPLVHPDVDYAEAYRLMPPEVEIAADRGEAGLAAFMRHRLGYYHAAVVREAHNMAPFRAALAEAPGFIDPSKVVDDAAALP
jgi:hypothetical protein